MGGEMMKRFIAVLMTVACLAGACTQAAAFEIPEAWIDRSEERRVGKECRSRWSPYH